ncbi:NYN domain-containing protein [Rhodobacter sp. NTK016B]|uniref:NYN domain-containing protein n=1 Tax=Rhodobacter sp. NTK016B TaxID=2759676 RepID=UPI001A8F9A6E|nr:NYN domain-containing protein [Rhodobacter sp. NTK016B]MBN8294242.1 NYN domain-containing protein [Rhodobacter sp. NTK016B]
MNQTSPFAAPLTRCRAVALLVDGENVSPGQAATCHEAAAALGPVTVARVYGDARNIGTWLEKPGYRAVHAGSGRNLTDMLLTVEAMELAFSGSVDGFALASNDGDFTPMVQALTARGFPVLGLIGPAASGLLRASFTQVHVLPLPKASKPSKSAAPKPKPAPEATARAALAKGPVTPQVFARAMQAAGHTVPKGSAGWRAWAKKALPGFRVEGSGPATRYRIGP